MKSSVWILNSALLLLCLFTFGFIYFSQQELPARTRLTSRQPVEVIKAPVATLDTSRIYENDLFGTYIAPHVPLENQEAKLPEVPSAPSMPPVFPTSAAPPQFLEPLPLTLVGIFADTNESKSRAIITNTRTKIQKSYRIGDSIEDAELIRIFETNVLFVRSNGQEETLFINQQAAQEDPSFNNEDRWGGVVLKENDTTYYINPTAFVEKIPHLAQLLEVLDVNTVYKKGIPFGVRIGKIAHDSLGEVLGLQSGDIVTSINNISTADTSDRVEIYNMIRHTPENGTILIKVSRNSQEIEYTYILRILEKVAVNVPDSQSSALPLPSISGSAPVFSEANRQRANINKETRMLAKAQVNFAPRIQQVQKRDKQAMMRKSKYNGLTQPLPS